MFHTAAGTVKENWDKDKPGWIRVVYSLGEAGKCLSAWMPMMVAYAGPDYGCYMLPEIGCEVIVGFIHDDEDQPFVMGCLMGHSSTVKASDGSEDNAKKVLRTKAGYSIVLDEKEQTLVCSDPKAENTVSINSKDGTVTVNAKTSIEFQIGGKTLIKLEDQKVTVLEDKAVITNKIELKASEVKVESSASLEIKGGTVKLEGKQLEIKAGASGKIESSGLMEVKASMLKLNG